MDPPHDIGRIPPLRHGRSGVRGGVHHDRVRLLTGRLDLRHQIRELGPLRVIAFTVRLRGERGIATADQHQLIGGRTRDHLRGHPMIRRQRQQCGGRGEHLGGGGRNHRLIRIGGPQHLAAVRVGDRGGEDSQIRIADHRRQRGGQPLGARSGRGRRRGRDLRQRLRGRRRIGDRQAPVLELVRPRFQCHDHTCGDAEHHDQDRCHHDPGLATPFGLQPTDVLLVPSHLPPSPVSTCAASGVAVHGPARLGPRTCPAPHYPRCAVVPPNELASRQPYPHRRRR